jgi:hypothetical protein
MPCDTTISYGRRNRGLPSPENALIFITIALNKLAYVGRSQPLANDKG